MKSAAILHGGASPVSPGRINLREFDDFARMCHESCEGDATGEPVIGRNLTILNMPRPYRCETADLLIDRDGIRIEVGDGFNRAIHLYSRECPTIAAGVVSVQSELSREVSHEDLLRLGFRFCDDIYSTPDWPEEAEEGAAAVLALHGRVDLEYAQ